jgi:hypothetical protein
MTRRDGGSSKHEVGELSELNKLKIKVTLYLEPSLPQHVHAASGLLEAGKLEG